MCCKVAAKVPNPQPSRKLLSSAGVYFLAIAEYQKTVALEQGNREAQCNRAVQLDNVGFVSLAIKLFELF
jgi:hypothetical protein